MSSTGWLPEQDNRPRAEDHVGLLAKAADIPVFQRTFPQEEGAGTLIKQRVYGEMASLMIAERTSGYHSKPHMHDAEQLNYVVEGEIWIFVEDKGYLCQKGDFQRVPRNKVHWAWNRSDKPVVLLEIHTPPMMIKREGQGEDVVGLFDEDENKDVVGPNNIHVPYDYEAVEAKYM